MLICQIWYMSRIEHTAFSNTCLLVCYSHDKVKRKHILLSEIEKKHRIFINATGPFLHSRKTPENFWFSDVYRGHRKNTSGAK